MAVIRKEPSISTTSFKWKQRIGYGISDFACNLIWQMITLYLLFFYTDVMQLSAASISLMFVMTRFFDGITDLLVGYMIDHTNTKWGKSRPYFLFGAIPFALFAYLCFRVPDISVSGKLLYAYVTYFGLSLAYTVVNVPMASILPSLTNDTHERTALSTSRKFFGFLGATIVSAFSLMLVQQLGGQDQALGFQRVMLIFGLISCVLFVITFLNVKEINVIEKQHFSIKEIISSLKSNRPWLIFALNIIFMWTGYFMQTSTLVYYYTVVVGSAALSITIATIMSIVPMFANFFVPLLAKYFGKKKLFLIASSTQLAGIICILLTQTNQSFILIGAVISAIGYGVKESIYFSMQADPVDYGEWKTGMNLSGSISAANGFLGKIAQALAGGVAGMLFSWSQYLPNSAIQSEKAIFAIQALYGYIPIILIAFSMITMSFYKLDSQFVVIKKNLEERTRGR